TAYGGIQQPMQTIVGLLTDLRVILSAMLGYISRLADFILPAKTAINAGANALGLPSPFSMGMGKLPSSTAGKMAKGMQMLMGMGIPMTEAAAIVGQQLA